MRELGGGRGNRGEGREVVVVVSSILIKFYLNRRGGLGIGTG